MKMMNYNCDDEKSINIIDELKKLVDIEWIVENPESAKELIDLILEQRGIDKDYIFNLEYQYELLRESCLLLRAIVESINAEEDDDE